jgi:hypothetical protein
MSIYTVKPFKTRSLKGYKLASLKELKQGDLYYTKDPFTTKMTNEWTFDPDFQKREGLLSYYLRDLQWQIDNLLLWVKI